MVSSRLNKNETARLAQGQAGRGRRMIPMKKSLFTRVYAAEEDSVSSFLFLAASFFRFIIANWQSQLIIVAFAIGKLPSILSAWYCGNHAGENRTNVKG